MTDLRKAAEMALDFCEDIGNLGGPYPYVNETAIVSDGRKVLQALRQALAQPDEVLVEREACAKLCDDRVDAEYATGKVDHNEMGWTQACAQAIRARSEKSLVKSYCGGKPNYCTPEQGNSSPNYPISESSTPFVDTVNTSQARVEYDRQGNIARLFGPIEPDGTLLYAAPPKREWVGLTDDEIYDYADKFLYQHGSNFGIKSFGKAVEAKLKEKNT
jgi:hypothetical protein